MNRRYSLGRKSPRRCGEGSGPNKAGAVPSCDWCEPREGLAITQRVKPVSPIRRQAPDALRRARRLPIGHDRNDLRQLALGLLWLEKRGYLVIPERFSFDQSELAQTRAKRLAQRPQKIILGEMRKIGKICGQLVLFFKRPTWSHRAPQK
jgi:hypothetical protein